MHAPEPLITLDNVCLTMRDPSGAPAPILRDVSCRVDAGTFVSISGASGSGKTSLLTVIAGLERVTSGSIRIAGKDISGAGEDALAAFRRDHIGIIFQNFHLISSMTALENVAAGAELAGDNDARAKAADALDAVGLSAREKHFPEQLSGGEQQRVALARAFVRTPPLLLADEPTGNLDSANGERVMELLFSLRETAGTTLILVTHDRRLAEKADTRLTMKDGRLSGLPEESNAHHAAC